MTTVIETVIEYETQPPCKTAAQMEDICCEATPLLQCCEKSNGSWVGFSIDELMEKYHPALDSLGRDSTGRVISIELQPRENPCGQKIIEYDVSGGQCCDEVTEIVFDEDSTPDLLPAGGSIKIYVTGGKTPLTFTTTSDNTNFQSGRKQHITTNNYVTIYANGDFCGLTEVSVTDGCSTTKMMLGSSEGTWYYIDDSCGFGGTVDDSQKPGAWIPSQVHGFTAQSSAYKQLESMTLGAIADLSCHNCDTEFPDNEACHYCSGDETCSWASAVRDGTSYEEPCLNIPSDFIYSCILYGGTDCGGSAEHAWMADCENGIVVRNSDITGVETCCGGGTGREFRYPVGGGRSFYRWGCV